VIPSEVPMTPSELEKRASMTRTERPEGSLDRRKVPSAPPTLRAPWSRTTTP
jgi:hypothetical protein